MGVVKIIPWLHCGESMERQEEKQKANILTRILKVSTRARDQLYEVQHQRSK